MALLRCELGSFCSRESWLCPQPPPVLVREWDSLRMQRLGQAKRVAKVYLFIMGTSSANTQALLEVTLRVHRGWPQLPSTNQFWYFRGEWVVGGLVAGHLPVQPPGKLQLQ